MFLLDLLANTSARLLKAETAVPKTIRDSPKPPDHHINWNSATLLQSAGVTLVRLCRDAAARHGKPVTLTVQAVS